MPAEFRHWVAANATAGFEWPSSDTLGNALKYLREQYADNVTTNLRTHCKNRLKLFFRLRAYEWNHAMFFQRNNNQNQFRIDAKDITNAINYTYKRRDTTTNPDEQHRLGILLDSLRECGAPHDCNIINYVDEQWFQSMWMWLEIQRYIHRFQQTYRNVINSWNLFHRFPEFVQRPEAEKPPKCQNFTIIPMCSFQRRHIRIDTDQLYSLVCKLQIVPKKIGKRKKFINITQDEFLHDKSGSWNLFFDREKIDKMVHSNRPFDKQIVSDGVSVTVSYLKPKEQQMPISNEKVLEMYYGGIFYYILGIDPGERTYNATVRKNIYTGEEVPFNQYFDHSHIYFNAFNLYSFFVLNT